MNFVYIIKNRKMQRIFRYYAHIPVKSLEYITNYLKFKFHEDFFKIII